MSNVLNSTLSNPTRIPTVKRARLIWPVVMLCMLVLGGCGQPFWLPPAHKIEVQQGNLISDTQRQQVSVGQTRAQILDLLGQPVLETPFHDDRWNYAYSRGPAGSVIVTRKLTIVFSDEKVVEVIDNHDKTDGEKVPRRWWQLTSHGSE